MSTSDRSVESNVQLARNERHYELQRVPDAGGAYLEVPGSGLGTAPESQQQHFSLRKVLRYKGTILLAFLVIAIPGVIAPWLLFEPEYTAEALLEVRSLIPRLLYKTEDTGVMPRYEQYRFSQVEIMQSATVLGRVLERADVRQTDWYNAPPSVLAELRGRQADDLQRLRGAVEAQPINRTELIRIAATTPWPQDAKVLVDAVLDEYIVFSRERLSEEDQRILNEILQAKETLEAEIAFSERVVTQARKDLRTGSPTELIAQRRVRLDATVAEIQDIELELAVLRERLRELQAESEAGEGEALGQRKANYFSDAGWQRLREKILALEGEISRASERFGPESDRIRTLQTELEQARTLLAERESYLDEVIVSGAAMDATGAAGLRTIDADTLAAEIRRLETRRRLLDEHRGTLSASFDRDFNAAESLRRHTEDLERNKEKLRAVARRLEELQEKDRVPATIRTISRATVPKEPSRDRRVKLSAVAMVGALFCGLGLAFLRVRFNPRIDEAGDMRQSVRGPFLGYMPLRSSKQNGHFEVTAEHAEAARIVRTALLNQLGTTTGNVVQVTSAGSGSGKSTLALLLARSIAQSGRKVLLVDADLRRASLAGRLGIEAAPGLSDLLAAPEMNGSATRTTDIPTLHVVPAGTELNGDHRELLGSEALTRCLERWRGEFDLIIADGPPLLAGADAAVLSREVDGTLLVVRERHCRRSGVLEAIGLLTAAGGRLLGSVFVGSGAGEHAYGYSYNYSYNYGYGHGAAGHAGSTADAAQDGGGRGE